MFKKSNLHTNNALKPMRQHPEEVKAVPQITTAPSKGQKSNPLKYSDVPAQIKKRLRKSNTKDLGRIVEKAGGPMSPKGRAAAAVLEERSVNPNLAGENPMLAKQSPYSVYKRASYNRAVDEINKFASPLANPNQLMNQNRQQQNPEQNVANTAGGVMSGIGMGAAGGAVAGGLGGLSLGVSKGGGVLGSLGTAAVGSAIGAGIGAGLGGYFGSKGAKESLQKTKSF